MISKIMSDPVTPHVLIGVFGGGVMLIVCGALCHAVAAGGYLCGIGSVVVVAAMGAGAVKVDHYLKSRRMAESFTNPQATYIPSDPSGRDWKKLQQKNPQMKIASTEIVNGDPDVRGNVTFDELNRMERGIRDKDL